MFVSCYVNFYIAKHKMKYVGSQDGLEKINPKQNKN